MNKYCTLGNWDGLGAWKCNHRPCSNGEQERLTIQRVSNGWNIVTTIPQVKQPDICGPYATRDELYEALWARYEAGDLQAWQGTAQH